MTVTRVFDCPLTAMTYRLIGEPFAAAVLQVTRKASVLALILVALAGSGAPGRPA